MELKRNIAWVRRERPILHADGVFGTTITMNPCAIVEKNTIYLFYAADDENRRRQIRLATAPVNDPENFTFHSVVIRNSQTPGDFDYAWCVLPHVVKLPDGTYFMVYSGNRGSGKGLAAFPGLGIARSSDLIHWEKYENNPVISPEGEADYPLIGIAGGGLYCEDLEDGAYKLHLFYTGCPSNGDNIFLNQQKSCNYATSTDGIHWVRRGAVHKRTTARDYENIASTGGPVLRDSDGMWRHWYSAIGTRWGVYSIAYAESVDGLHWNRGTRYGENLAIAPEVRDIGELGYLPRAERWQDQSVSYPSVIRLGDGLRMYYCGNDYGCGGIGTAVAAPMRIALTGQTRGEAKLWIMGDDKQYLLQLSSVVSTKQTGTLEPGEHQEGITHNCSVFYEEFPEKDGVPLFSLRTAIVHREDGIRFDLFAENASAISYDDVCVAVKCGGAPVTLTASDGEVTYNGDSAVIHMKSLASRTTVCVHVHIGKKPISGGDR